jgi:hypothetical protein
MSRSNSNESHKRDSAVGIGGFVQRVSDLKRGRRPTSVSESEVMAPVYRLVCPFILSNIIPLHRRLRRDAHSNALHRTIYSTQVRIAITKDYDLATSPLHRESTRELCRRWIDVTPVVATGCFAT